MPVSTAAACAPVATDMELRAHADHHDSLRLWLRLLSCTTRIEDTIRQRLREQFGLTLPRFDLMAQLEREPQGLTMSALSRRMLVTGGNVTAIVAQLESEQLVQRQTDAETAAPSRFASRRPAAVPSPSWPANTKPGSSTCSRP
jgi:hypothetical protein